MSDAPATRPQRRPQHAHGPVTQPHFLSLWSPRDRSNPDLGRSRKSRLELRVSATSPDTATRKRMVESAGSKRARIRAGHRLPASHQRERGRARIIEHGSGRRTSCGPRPSAMNPRGGILSTAYSGLRPSAAVAFSNPLHLSSSRHLHAVTALRATG